MHVHLGRPEIQIGDVLHDMDQVDILDLFPDIGTSSFRYLSLLSINSNVFESTIGAQLAKYFVHDLQDRIGSCLSCSIEQRENMVRPAGWTCL